MYDAGPSKHRLRQLGMRLAVAGWGIRFGHRCLLTAWDARDAGCEGRNIRVLLIDDPKFCVECRQRHRWRSAKLQSKISQRREETAWPGV